jgi:glucokinase-like ROK family protein
MDLEIDPRGGNILGIEMGVNFISVIIMDLAGAILWRQQQETDEQHEQEKVVSRALDMLRQALEQQEKSETRLLGIGMTLPGLVDTKSGLLMFSPNLQWRKVPIHQMISDATHLPVLVDNDANAAALAEHLFGSARKVRHFLFITIGIGVGGGLFLNGEIYRGAGGYAGEIGHTCLSPSHTQPCRCGNSGCWENSTNQYSLVERVRNRLDVGRASSIYEMIKEKDQPLTPTLIAQAAKQGDKQALEALTETGEFVGLKVANLVNIFNPEMVILGGSTSEAIPYMLPAIQEVVEERALPECREGLQILISSFGRDACVKGAAALMVHSILEKPTRVPRLKNE